MLPSVAGSDGFTAAHHRLRDAQKSAKGSPAYSVYVNRPLGRVLAALAYRLGRTPDQVTYLSAAFSFAGIICLATLEPTWWLGLLVCLALVLGYALDSADGQLARLRGGGSTVGEWLDHMIDVAKISSLHLAVLIAAYRHFELPDQAWLLVPVVFTVVSAVHFFGMILVDQLTRTSLARSGLAAPVKAPASRLRSLLKLPTDYGVLCLIFILLGSPAVFFAAYAVLALGSTGYLLLVVRKWRLDVVRLDVSTGV